jgi:prevent-host-death family protein
MLRHPGWSRQIDEPGSRVHNLARNSGQIIYMTKWSLQDAKNHFSEVVTAARRTPQTVTKHGKPAVVIVDAELYERQIKKRKIMKGGKEWTFVDQLLAMPYKEGFEIERRKPKRRNIDF